MTKAEFEKWRDDKAQIIADGWFDCNQRHNDNCVAAQQQIATATYEMMQDELKLLADVVGVSDEEAVILNLKAQLAIAIQGMDKIGPWMSAALDDPKVCNEMKADIREYFEALAQIDLKPVAVVEVHCSFDDYMPADIQKGWCGSERSPFTETHKGILVVLPNKDL